MDIMDGMDLMDEGRSTAIAMAKRRIMIKKGIDGDCDRDPDSDGEDLENQGEIFVCVLS